MSALMSDMNPTDIEGARDALEKRAEAAEKKAQFFASDLKRCMSDLWGRRLVWHLLEQTGAFRLSFAGEATHSTAFAEGGRNQGLMLIAALHENCLREYGLMVKENRST